tara:strand:+ start:218 stop:502 length:285 start_codon:yes stop_codon:yes gene_type:complete
MSIRDWIADYNEEALLADGFDEAIIGMCERFGNTPVVAYDRDKCIEILMDEFAQDTDDDEEEDLSTRAIEYFDYNVMGAYVGEFTPVFLTVYLP